MERYDPFEEMDRMFEQFRTRMWTPEGSLRGDFGMPVSRGKSASEGVSMDLKQHGDEYVFVADLPGFEREEIGLTFSDGVLTLAAESETREETTDEEGEIALRGEIARSRRVSERVTIPEAVIEDEISASYRNGVLEVHLPLLEPEAGDEDDGTKIDISE